MLFKNFNCSILFVVGLLALSNQTIAQDVTSDSAFYASVMADAAETSANAKTWPGIYNGTEYTPQPSGVQGFPFFASDEWQTGSILFDNNLYTDVRLKYDLVSDELVVQHPSGTSITVFSPRVQSFIINGHKFVYLGEQGLKPGFYEQLAAGKVTLVSKQVKMLEQRAGTELERFFSEKKTYYLLKDGKSYTVNSEKAVINLLFDAKTEINQYLKKNKSAIGKNKELAMVKIAEYYNNH